MIIANFLASPTERFIKERYINSAKRKLRKKEYKNLIRIGITGSYGKTSTKFILQTILSEKYNVLATPESYNTTMGNVKVIREMLNKDHEVLISEMGARYRFDIQEICDFVKPKIGLITSIGPQHLESFKNIDNIVKTKSELLDSLPDDGIVFLPNDDSHCLKLYNKEKREKYIYGINDKHADVYAKDIRFNDSDNQRGMMLRKAEDLELTETGIYLYELVNSNNYEANAFIVEETLNTYSHLFNTTSSEVINTINRARNTVEN